MGANLDEEIKAVKTAFAKGECDPVDVSFEEQELTVSKLKYFLPKNSKVNVTQGLVDTVNNLINESGVHRGLMEEKLVTYTHLLGPGIGMKQLLKAIQFVILSTTPGMTQTKAYMATFPKKAQELLDRGADPSSHASMYAKTKLVQEIMVNSQIGASVVYAPLQHQLIQKMLELSNGKAANGDYASPTVQLNATLGLLDYIKPPEEQTINLKTGADEQSIAAQNRLADEISKMAEIQLSRIRGGEALEDIQKVGIVVDTNVVE